jgi:hypothetical protein
LTDSWVKGLVDKVSIKALPICYYWRNAAHVLL